MSTPVRVRPPDAQPAGPRRPAVPGRAIVFDVDGVISPVHPGTSVWGDEIVAGNVFGPVLVSPRMCQRLELLSRANDVRCWWLTSWTREMRANMYPFPGRDWATIAEQSQQPTNARRWWKLAALEAWLDAHPEVRELAWCDDHLVGGRPAALRRRLNGRGIEPLLLAPATNMGLTPRHLEQLESWTGARRPPRRTAAG